MKPHGIFRSSYTNPRSHQWISFLPSSSFTVLELGVVQCDQGGELARREMFWTVSLEKLQYVVEPIGANSPSHNGGVEKCNDTLSVSVTVCALLHGAALQPKYWSITLLHATYLHNQRVH